MGRNNQKMAHQPKRLGPQIKRKVIGCGATRLAQRETGRGTDLTVMGGIVAQCDSERWGHCCADGRAYF